MVAVFKHSLSVWFGVTTSTIVLSPRYRPRIVKPNRIVTKERREITLREKWEWNRKRWALTKNQNEKDLSHELKAVNLCDFDFQNTM